MKGAHKEAEIRFSRAQWSALVVLCLAILFEGMNFASVVVQVPPLRQDLGLSPGEVQLVVSAFLTLFAGLLLIGGRIADVAGRRRTFLAAVGLFGLGSLLAAVAPNAPVLILARALQGAGAAITVPAAMSLITTMFEEGPARNRALGVWAATAASGSALGLVVAGMLTELFGWRSGFLLYVPLALGMIIAARALVPADGPRDRSRRVGVGGALVGTLGLLLVVYGLGELPAVPSLGLAAVAVGVVLLLAFLRAERRRREPLVPLSVFASAPVIAANAVAFAFFAGLITMNFLLALYLQDVLGYGPFAAGLAFLPAVVLTAVINPMGAGVVTRIGARSGLAIGSLVVAAGLALLVLISAEDRLFAVVIPATLLVGLGVALVYPAMTIAAVSGVPGERHGMASGLMFTSQQSGGALGVAAAALLVGAVNGGTLAEGPGDIPGLRAGFLLAAAIVVAGAGAALLAFRRARKPVSGAEGAS